MSEPEYRHFFTQPDGDRWALYVTRDDIDQPEPHWLLWGLFYIQQGAEQHGLELTAPADDLVDAATLTPGTAFYFPVWGDGPLLTVLRAAEPFKDTFDRDLIQYWVRREQDGEEGQMAFDPGSKVRLASVECDHAELALQETYAGEHWLVCQNEDCGHQERAS